MLEAVGRPRPLNPDEKLEDIAAERDWPTSRLFRPKSIGPADVVRSLGAYGGLGFGVVAGVGSALLNGSRRSGANLAAAVGSDLALAAGGITMNVIGQENLWAARPAVFLFNHQSQLDVLILGALLRQDFTGVAKIDLSKDPMFAPVGYLMDVAYIDRGNTAQARKALAPVVEALEGGRSIAIAPRAPARPPTASCRSRRCLPHRHAGRGAAGADRDPQRRRTHASTRGVHGTGSTRREGAPADPHHRLDAGQPRREG